MRSLDLRALTWLHTCRIVVGLMLYAGWQQGQLPKAMTFEGRNFDILSRLTAPLLWAYLRFPARPRPWVMNLWNLLCPGLLANIVVTAVLSLPGPMQVLNHATPNRLVLTSPSVLLHAPMVPLVLFAHLCVLLRSWTVADR